MKKPVKALLGVVTLLIIVAVLALAYALLVVDPNSYKGQIQDAAARQGVSLEIRGDLEWNLFPNLAIRMGETHFSSDSHGIPESSFREAHLVLGWLALFQQKIAVEALIIDGADLRLREPGQGVALAASPAAGSTPATQGGDPAFSLAVEQLKLTNSRITLPGEEEPTVLRNLNLDSRRLNLEGETFPITLAFDYEGPLSEAPINLTYEGEASFSEKDGAIQVADNRLTLTGLVPEPLEIRFGLSVDMESESITLDNLRGDAGPAAFTGEIAVNGYSDQPAFSGSLEVPAFDVKSLLNQWFDAGLKTADADALTRVGFSTDFAGTSAKVILDNLQLRLDDTVFNGNLRFGLAAPRTLQMALRGNALGIDGYLAPDNGDKTQAGKQAAALFAPIAGPLAMLEGGTGQVDVTLDKLVYDKTAVTDLHLALAARGQTLEIKDLTASVYGGQLATTGKLDLAAKTPALNFSQQLTDIRIQQAVAQFADQVDFSGILTLNARGNTAGSSTDTLIANLRARGDFQVADPRLATINVERSYCELAALVEQRPERTEPWPQGTQLNNLTGSFHIDDSVLHLDTYNTGVGNLKLKGDGTIDLDDQAFDLLLVSNLQGDRTSENGCIVKSKRIRNRDIPIRCKDSFADAGAGSCKPDQAFVNKVLQDEVMDKIREKTGMDEDSSKALEGLLRGFLGGGDKNGGD
jgi:uncharacterized protein involved in outer membrane biogenesis